MSSKVIVCRQPNHPQADPRNRRLLADMRLRRRPPGHAPDHPPARNRCAQLTCQSTQAA